MSIMTSYLNSTKNFEAIMNSILGAKAPERVTSKFLEDLGYKSSNDRLMVGVLRGLGFIDENGAPTQVYYDFLDQTQSKKVLARQIEIAYEDLFNLRRDAQNMTPDEVKNKLRSITQGQKGDRVIELMELTFRTLCSYADWSEPRSNTTAQPEIESKPQQPEPVTHEHKAGIVPQQMGLHYNIQIHLPETTNMAVYDAIFSSLKKHLF